MVKRKTKRRVKKRPPRIFEKKGKLYIIIGKKKFLINPKPSSLKNDYTKRELLDIILKKMRVKRRRKKPRKTVKGLRSSVKEKTTTSNFKELQQANLSQSKNIISALTVAKSFLPDVNLQTRKMLNKKEQEVRDKGQVTLYKKNKKQLDDEIKKLNKDLETKKIDFKKGETRLKALQKKIDGLTLLGEETELETQRMKNELEKSHFDLLYNTTMNRYNQLKVSELRKIIKDDIGEAVRIYSKERGRMILLSTARKQELKDYINDKNDIDFIELINPKGMTEYEEERDERGLTEERRSLTEERRPLTEEKMDVIPPLEEEEEEEKDIDEATRFLEETQEEKERFKTALNYISTLDKDQLIDNIRLFHNINKINETELEDATEKELRDWFMERLDSNQVNYFVGDGISKGVEDGLSNFDIENMLNTGYRKKGFLGVIPSDYVNKIDPKRKRKFAFIMNTDPSTKKGKHWIGCFIDTKKDLSVEYFDSFAKEPSKDFLTRIKKLIDKLKINVYLKLKINKIKQQASDTQNCGFFAMKFIMDRLNGNPFKLCSGYNDVQNGEEKIQLLKQKFGYI